ncbi:MAG: hypothetical protein H6667_14495 [Ardenticatenaceae bacterium]|nr:hypothetical protein [Ardenticatenaceae bacterium]MCB9445552.1 hypothetical protein [Ardenticatenaceae bacterium]
MMKRFKPGGVTAVLTTLLTVITACTAAVQPTSQPAPEPERPLPNLPDLGEAPEIGNDVWINSDAPVTLAASRGQVVLLEFWTFG